MATMVLERKTLPRSLSSFFAVSRIAAIPRDNGVFLTTAPETNEPLDLINASESTLDFWDNAEDEVWDHV